MNKYIIRAEAYKKKAKQIALDGLEKMKAEYDDVKSSTTTPDMTDISTKCRN